MQKVLAGTDWEGSLTVNVLCKVKVVPTNIHTMHDQKVYVTI